MIIRKLNTADASIYRSLMLHAYEHAADAFTSMPHERAIEPESWWVNRIAHPKGLCVAFGTFDGEHLVGNVALEFSPKPKTLHSALVIGMYVLAEHRGRGLARALLQAAVDDCVARPDILAMKLDVTEGNEVAIALYKSFGFETFGVEPMAILTPSGFKRKVHMWKPMVRVEGLT